MSELLQEIIEQHGETKYFFQDVGFVKLKELDDETQLEIAQGILENV